MSTKRTIFEEVSSVNQTHAAQPGMIDKGRDGARGAIRVWLMILFGLGVLMILVGGLTRLTDSGLSITEWRPFTGAIPPLNAADWQSEFAKYQEIDENLEAAIITPDYEIVDNADKLKPAYIIFKNYELILKWNRSLRFALAVCTLKEKFKNEL